MSQPLIVKKFTSDETLKILFDLLIENKASAGLYTLFGLWTANIMGNSQSGILRTLIGKGIDCFNFSNNSDYYQDIIQETIAIFSKHGISEKTGKGTGLKYKVSWDKIPMTQPDGSIIYNPVKGNERQIIQYLKTCFKNALFKALNTNIRQGISPSTICSLKKRQDLLDLKSKIDNATDKTLTNLELIADLKRQGYTDNQFYHYRLAFNSGDLSNFTSLTDEYLERKPQAVDAKLANTQDSLTKELYEEIYGILNSKALPLVQREFLKAFYEMPTVIRDGWRDRVYVENIGNFLSKFPEYMPVFKVKKVSYLGGKKVVRWLNSNRPENLSATDIYAKSHESLKEFIKPALERFIERQQMVTDHQEDCLEYENQDNADKILTSWGLDPVVLEEIVEEGIF